MNRPNAASPRPISSGWWCPRGFRVVRFLTREGVFGRTLLGRFLRAMGALSTAVGLPLHRAFEDARRDRALGHVRVRRVVEHRLVEAGLLPARDDVRERL